MPDLTRALVQRHALGRADAYDAALLDIAQDHLLYLLAEVGCFDGDRLVFKGGTSLRKCRLGNDGRFSTDLDFAAPDEEVVLDTCERIDGALVGGFRFGLHSDRGDGRHWRLRVDHDELGSPDIAASVEFARRPLALPTERKGFVSLPVHKNYDFALPELPVVAEPEACAEKLARYRRIALGRDVYDLNHFANRQMDEPLVRRLWVLKVWGDVVDDARGPRPLDANDVLRARRPQDFTPDSVGVLTRPVDLEAWGGSHTYAVPVPGGSRRARAPVGCVRPAPSRRDRRGARSASAVLRDLEWWSDQRVSSRGRRLSAEPTIPAARASAPGMRWP